MYNKIFKNNQVTYGIPFQVRIPLTLQNIKQQEEGQGIFVTPMMNLRMTKILKKLLKRLMKKLK